MPTRNNKGLFLLPGRLNLSLVRDLVERPVVSLLHFFIVFLHICRQIISEISLVISHGRLLSMGKGWLRFVGGDRVVGGFSRSWPLLLRGILVSTFLCRALSVAPLSR